MGHSSAQQPLFLVELYEQGVLTMTGLTSHVLEALTVANVSEFLDKCPPEVMRALNQDAMDAPLDSDEEGWSKQIFIASYCGPTISQDEAKTQQRDTISRIRSGLTVFRAAIAKR